MLQGRIRAVESSTIGASPTYRAELCDESGGLTLLFYGRRRIDGMEPGTLVRVEGRVGERHGYLAMANPSYELLPRTRRSHNRPRARTAADLWSRR